MGAIVSKLLGGGRRHNETSQTGIPSQTKPQHAIGGSSVNSSSGKLGQSAAPTAQPQQPVSHTSLQPVDTTAIRNGPKKLQELLSRSHRDAWIPRFRGHLEDTEKNELPKLKWRVDLLDFVISLHDLRDILKDELSSQDWLSRRKVGGGVNGGKNSLRRSGSSSSSSDEETLGHKNQLQNAQNKKRELCERLFKDHFQKKKMALSDSKVRSNFVQLLKEQMSRTSNLSETVFDKKDHLTKDKELFSLIEKVHEDAKVWRELDTLCSEYLNTLLKRDSAIMAEASKAVLMCIL